MSNEANTACGTKCDKCICGSEVKPEDWMKSVRNKVVSTTGVQISDEVIAIIAAEIGKVSRTTERDRQWREKVEGFARNHFPKHRPECSIFSEVSGSRLGPLCNCGKDKLRELLEDSE